MAVVSRSAQSPERPQRCNQLFLDPILTELASSFETVKLRHRCRLESVTEAEDHVIATVHEPRERPAVARSRLVTWSIAAAAAA